MLRRAAQCIKRFVRSVVISQQPTDSSFPLDTITGNGNHEIILPKNKSNQSNTEPP